MRSTGSDLRFRLEETSEEIAYNIKPTNIVYLM